MTSSKMNPKNIDAAQEALGKPALCEFSDKTWRIRTLLLVASIASLMVVTANLHVEPSSSIFGLRFTGLTDHIVHTWLFLIVAYLLIHFLWSSFDNFIEWRLRLTGTKVAFITGAKFTSEHGDYPNDPRQSTLYNWWLREAKKINNIPEKIKEIESMIKEWDEAIREKYNSGADAMNIVNACTVLTQAQASIGQLTNSIKEASKTIDASRIPVSLERFDGWFKFFLNSQNTRWLLIEFLLPIVISACALWKLL